MKITFNRRYDKMPVGWERSRLLTVIPCDRKDMSQEFVAYDTAHDGQTESIKPGKYLILLLQSAEGYPWTTVRPAWPREKVEYYNRCVGKWFDCIVDAEWARRLKA
jgi:hypothetical protein